MMGKPCTYCALYQRWENHAYVVRYINDGKTMHMLYVISMMGKPCICCTLYNVRYINDGKTMYILYVI